jgi:molecular chaperone DnaK
MVTDAESHADEDKKRREEIEARNRLDAMVYEVEKNVKEWEDKLDASAKETLNAALERGRKALKQGDTDEIRSANEALQQAYSAAGAAIYAQQSAAAPGADAGFTGGATGGAGFDSDATSQATGTGTGSADDVVEADYEIVEDEKK